MTSDIFSYKMAENKASENSKRNAFIYGISFYKNNNIAFNEHVYRITESNGIPPIGMYIRPVLN